MGNKYINDYGKTIYDYELFIFLFCKLIIKIIITKIIKDIFFIG